jgi:hypothetical protein
MEWTELFLHMHHLKPAADLGVGPISVRREGEPARWPGGVSLRPDSDLLWFVSGPNLISH